jgi:hypothetical protein
VCAQSQLRRGRPGALRGAARGARAQAVAVDALAAHVNVLSFALGLGVGGTANTVFLKGTTVLLRGRVPQLTWGQSAMIGFTTTGLSLGLTAILGQMGVSLGGVGGGLGLLPSDHTAAVPSASARWVHPAARTVREARAREQRAAWSRHRGRRTHDADAPRHEHREAKRIHRMEQAAVYHRSHGCNYPEEVWQWRADGGGLRCRPTGRRT